MHRILKLTPLLSGVVALSACSALNGVPNTSMNSAGLNAPGEYVKVAANSHANTHSDYSNSGWYSQTVSPYAGGNVSMNTNSVMDYSNVPNTPLLSQTYGQTGTVKTAHNGYHDAYGNPVPAPVGTNRMPVKTPSLRGAHGPSYYGNLGGIMYDVDSDLFGIIGRLGVEKSWYGAEVEGSFGVSDEDETIVVALPDGEGPLPVDVSAGIDYSLAAFAVGRLPIGSKLKALGRVGYHTTQIDVSGSAAIPDTGNVVMESESESFDGIAYGAGLEYNLDQVNGLRVDYTRYDLEDGATSDSIAATYLRRF